MFMRAFQKNFFRVLETKHNQSYIKPKHDFANSKAFIWTWGRAEHHGTFYIRIQRKWSPLTTFC